MADAGRAVALPAPGWYRPLVRAGDLTYLARGVLHAAAGEAHRLGSPAIGTGHLLLGLLRGREGIALDVLTRTGVGSAPAAAVLAHGPLVPWAGRGAVGLSAPAARALALAVAERARWGHRRTGTDHLLLGLLAVRGGGARHALRALGADPGGVGEALAAAIRTRDREAGSPSLAAGVGAMVIAGGPRAGSPQADRRRLLKAATVLAALVAGCGPPGSTPRVPTTPYRVRPTPAGPVVGPQLGHPLYEPALGVTVTDQADPVHGPGRGLPPVAGAVIEPATGDGQAAREGVRRGDVVVAVDGHDTPSWREFLALVQARRPGEEVELRLARAGADPAAPEEATARLGIGQR